MKIGAVLPQTELGADVAVLRAWAAAVEELGYHHILAYDHVVGADRAGHPDFTGPYDVDTTFHEPLVTFGYLAAITSLELVTGIVILPQRPTVLVAKQAAQVDLLTEGRLRLGVGIGWNQVEYEALGQDFTNRGQRLGEQVELLRQLWTRRSVSYAGRFDTVTAAGIAPLPVQRPIPIWFGANSPVALRRAGRLADGWFANVGPGPALEQAIEHVAAGARAVGRDPASIPLEGRVELAGGLDAAIERVDQWRQSGATYLTVNTMGMAPGGVATIDRHIAALADLAQALGLTGPPQP